MKEKGKERRDENENESISPFFLFHWGITYEECNE